MPPIGKVLKMWGAGRLQVHGICSRRLVHREVAEARSNYKRTYLWYNLEITLVVIQLGVTSLKKTRFVWLLDLFGGRRRRGGVI